MFKLFNLVKSRLYLLNLQYNVPLTRKGLLFYRLFYFVQSRSSETQDTRALRLMQWKWCTGWHWMEKIYKC